MSAPVHYHLAIFPGYQLLDLAGPIDILNSLSIIQPDTPLNLTVISDTLEPVPSKPIPPASAKWTFDLQSAFPQSNGKVNTTFNQYLKPDITYAQYLSALEKGDISPTGAFKPIDVLIVPGGHGTRLDRVHPDQTKTSNVAALLDFLPKVAAQVNHAIVTVCTGSDAVAQTGLLDARRATTNMALFQQVAARSPQVQWQTWARWVRSLPSESPKAVDVEIWTSAGISAGMDVTLAFIAHHYGGVEVARALAKRLEYDWREVAEGAQDPLYEKHWQT